MARMSMETQLVIAVAFIAAALLHGTTADNIVVGGTRGWTVPPTTNTTFYSSWTSTETFEVNDTLVFNFVTGTHDVARVTKVAYDACNTTNTINIMRTGPANVKLDTPGQLYYICTIPGHCLGGQKLAINVVADTDDDSSPSPSPSGTGSTPPTTTAPPTPNSTSSRGVTLSAILISIVVALSARFA